MKKNKFLALLLCLSVAFAFTACGAEEPTMADEYRTEIDAAQAASEDNENYGELSKEAIESGISDQDKTAVTGVGDTMSNDFFDWTVNSYTTKTKTHGTSAGDGYKFVIINMSITNTEDYEYETGNYEFRGVISGQEEDLDSENAFYDGMIADETTIAPGETITGDVIFKVPEDCTALLINYLEVYGDGSEGNMYWYELSLK